VAAPTPSARGSSLPPWELDEDSLLGEPMAGAPVRHVAAESRAATYAQGPADRGGDARPVPPEADEPIALDRPVVRPTTTQTEAADAAAPAATDAERACTDRWLGCVEQWLAGNALFGLVRELAWQAQCVGIDESAAPPTWTLRVERESLRQSSHRDRLQDALAELLGAPVRLAVVAGATSDSAARRDAAAKAAAQERAEAVIRNDPVVVELLARYPGAQIVPGSIRPT
jgi:DNA polymerase-3 subunit gamma/tau